MRVEIRKTIIIAKKRFQIETKIYKKLLTALTYYDIIITEREIKTLQKGEQKHEIRKQHREQIHGIIKSFRREQENE